ncbi:MAG: hypothetical protein FJ388_19035 [Verrucomicrobia bacterium]|nr:hypothetical protein [Verrucomicrobiota bacterium]
MTVEQIKARLAEVADELVTAQGKLAELMDGGAAKVNDYVKAQGTIELLQAEQVRLVKELPRAHQRELDAAEVDCDAARKAAFEALSAARQAVSERLRSGGFSKVCNRELGEIVEMEDSVRELRGVAMAAGNAAHTAASRAARHHGENWPTEKRTA